MEVSPRHAALTPRQSHYTATSLLDAFLLQVPVNADDNLVELAVDLREPGHHLLVAAAAALHQLLHEVLARGCHL